MFQILTRVNVGVLFHVGLLVEPFAAVLTGVGPRVTNQIAITVHKYLTKHSMTVDFLWNFWWYLWKDVEY